MVATLPLTLVLAIGLWWSQDTPPRGSFRGPLTQSRHRPTWHGSKAWRRRKTPPRRSGGRSVVRSVRSKICGTPHSHASDRSAPARASAAQARIEEAFRGRSLISTSASLNEKWVHPGWHMGDSTPVPLAEARVAGRDFVSLQPICSVRHIFFFCGASPGCAQAVRGRCRSVRGRCDTSGLRRVDRARPGTPPALDYAQAGHPPRHHGRHCSAHRPATAYSSAGNTRLGSRRHRQGHRRRRLD